MGELLAGFVKVYRICISTVLPPVCRFTPTCSEYAVEALTKLPVRVAVPRIVRRVSRCHPWGGSGYDPVEGVEKQNAESSAG